MVLKVSLIQMNVEYARANANYERVQRLIEEAVVENPDVIVLPEMWNVGYALEKLNEVADKDGRTTKCFLAGLAQRFHVNIVGGSVATAKGNAYYNTSYVFNREGELCSEYDKVHLFGLMHEDKWITAGKKMNRFVLDDIPAAGVICYDIRFPEWERTLMSKGGKILFVSAQWPKERIEQWKIMLQSRAIENQAFVVAVNRIGEGPNGEHFSGHSLAIDPLGNILLRVPDDKEGGFTVNLNMGSLEKIRGEIPVFSDRRTELYH
ncbi:amidohydrolase [Liquorilactobacillus aquaticus DSM 21051]|uniref:Amidohydrolase n=1 Tax=Liquorilactobacillus aquaticus DSM 21051 TaxID=1423725 RepID=A0A0R2CTI6_9LACO|nr:carbon-nitrogen family hydrolase [Liquorilactobacillus aquaticus]KRM94951.1 amidohydrolase [Liquorilactobacillus aquaticus DSM 21051]